MNRTAADVRRACAAVLAAGFEPKADGTTFCNLAVHAILDRFGLGALVWDQERGRPMLANYMADKLESACRELTFDEAFGEANKGSLVVAALKMPGHGHVAVVYPFPARFTSGKWMRWDIPCVANVGKENGVMPLNWAFGAKPRLWLVPENKQEEA
jgi:hypothetical protein